jgi:hypothetical protein
MNDGQLAEQESLPLTMAGLLTILAIATLDSLLIARICWDYQILPKLDYFPSLRSIYLKEMTV